ncbi:MAG: hypothetical protein KDA61_03745, partial [Planctomycetales bacterium]|nr:hypothetical protein [Planctomycetales bacterium]
GEAPAPTPGGANRIPPERLASQWNSRLAAREKNLFLVVNYLDKLVSFKSNGYQESELELLLWLEKTIENMTENHRLVLVALRDAMIPMEL